MATETRIPMPPWGDGTAAAATTTKPKPKHHRHRLEAPVTATAIASSSTATPRVIPPSKQRRIAWYTWATWAWMGTLTIIVFFLLLFSGKTATTPHPPAAGGAAAVQGQKRNPHHVKVYPFNVYESTAGTIVRYPREGGIPQLDWSAVKHFEACCRDDTSLHCFTASELALRRDPARTARGLPDVYVEIFSAPRWVQVGSRCQLVWSTEKADVES